MAVRTRAMTCFIADAPWWLRSGSEAVLRGELDPVEATLVAADHRALGVDVFRAEVGGRDGAPDQVDVLRAVRLVDADGGAGGRVGARRRKLQRRAQLR